MAYDEELADRIRDLVGDEPGLTEQKMFGGLAFLIGGNMAIAASGQGGILVHADPDESDSLVASTDAYLMEMRGKQMRGLAPRRLRARGHEAAAGEVGRGRNGLRPLAAGEALVDPAERAAVEPRRERVRQLAPLVERGQHGVELGPGRPALVDDHLCHFLGTEQADRELGEPARPLEVAVHLRARGRFPPSAQKPASSISVRRWRE